VFYIDHRSSPITDHQRSTIPHHHRSSPINDHRSSPIITDHHRSPPIITDHHRSSPIITDHHRSLPIITEHYRALPITEHYRSPTTLHRKNKIQNKKSIRFDAALNWEDEDRRIAHGVEVRRERQQREKQRKMVRAEEARRVLEVVDILRERGRLQAVVAVCNNFFIRTLLSYFLSEVDLQGDLNTLDQRLDAFQGPNRVIMYRDLNETALEFLGALFVVEAFVREFFPASIVSSESEPDPFHEYYEGLVGAVVDGNDDEQHALANARNLANAVAQQDLNQDNAPDEDGAEGNENWDDAAAAVVAPSNYLV
jgi:hypothetical protein